MIHSLAIFFLAHYNPLIFLFSASWRLRALP